MNPQHAPIKGGNRKKLLIYAGLAAAMVLVFLLTRGSSSGSSSGTTDSTDAGTTIPATSDSGGGSDGVDDSSELAGIDTDIQTVGQAVAALQSAQTTAGTTSGTGDTDTVSSILTAAGTLFQQGAAAAGAGASNPINVNVTSPKQPGAGNTKVVKPGTKLAGGAIEAASGSSKPAAKSGYTVVGLGGGRWEYKPVKK